jgi:dTDP-4-amino-4,6-dideoxygalactose transaminase
VALFKLKGRDYDRLVNESVRGFAGGNLFADIRKQPSAPLLSLMARRLARFDFSRFCRRQVLGRRLLAALGQSVECPTLDDDHAFWVFPVLCDKPLVMIEALRRAGFDATQGQSLRVVETPLRSAGAPVAQGLLERMVFVPLCSEMSEATVDNLAQVILRASSLRIRKGAITD